MEKRGRGKGWGKVAGVRRDLGEKGLGERGGEKGLGERDWEGKGLR